MGPQTGSPARRMSASAESGLWVSEVSVVTKGPALWVSAVLVSLVLGHLPLWLPTAETSCKAERLLFGIPYEPRTTFPGAGSRPLLCVIGPGWITWHSWTSTCQGGWITLSPERPSQSWSGVTSLGTTGPVGKLDPGSAQEGCWVGLLLSVVSEKGWSFLGSRSVMGKVYVLFQSFFLHLSASRSPYVPSRGHAHTLYSSLEPCGTPTRSFHMTSSLLVLVYCRNTPIVICIALTSFSYLAVIHLILEPVCTVQIQLYTIFFQ